MNNCNLCLNSQASKIKSHIVPKWMGKSMLKTGKGNKGFLLNTSTIHKPRKQSQDTDKQANFLCEDCEKYFGIIESWFKSTIHDQIHGKKTDKNHKFYFNDVGVVWAEFEGLELLNITRLFFFSILWRVSLSKAELWQNLSLNQFEESYLRDNLLACLSQSKDELKSNLFNLDHLNSPWFVCQTCIEDTKKTANCMGQYPCTDGTHKLYLNEYILGLSFTPDDLQKSLSNLNNRPIDDKLKVVVLSKEIWNKQIETYKKFMIENSLFHLNKSGNQYFQNKRKDG